MPSTRSDSIGWAGGRSGAIFEISLKSRFLVAFCSLFCPSRPGKCPEAPWAKKQSWRTFWTKKNIGLKNLCGLLRLVPFLRFCFGLAPGSALELLDSSCIPLDSPGAPI